MKINERFVIVLFIISLFIIFFIPTISLKGDSYLKIPLNGEYKELGYRVFGWKTKNKVKVNNPINNQKIGKYEVVYQLNGVFNNKAIRTVEVVDEVKPEIKLYGQGYVCPGKEYEEEGYEAIDNYDGNITSHVQVKRKKDSILYSVEDSSHNKAEIIRKVQSGDIMKPTLTLNGEETIIVHLGDQYQEQGVKVIDNCDLDISNKVLIEGEVNTEIAGEYIIRYSVEDSSHNKSEVERKIFVVSEEQESTMDGIGKVIYLTFDDGPSRSITPELLQILREENVKATFFLINHDDSLNDLIKQEYDDGHQVALHSYTHDYSYVYSSIENYFQDLEMISNKVESIIGKRPNIIRFPGGSSNTISRKYSKGIMSILVNQVLEKGYIYFDWNISSEDAGSARSSSQVYDNVVNSLVYKNNVVLMHDFENNYKTLGAIRDIIRYGKDHGYTFKILDENTFPARHSVNN